MAKFGSGQQKATRKRLKAKASDSFKRAGFNWGIGRALYSTVYLGWKGLFK